MHILQPSPGLPVGILDFFSGLFQDMHPFVVILIILIIAMTFIIIRIAPSYYDNKKLKSEIDELKIALAVERANYSTLLVRMDTMRDEHAREIQSLNNKLLELSKSVLIIKNNYENGR